MLEVVVGSSDLLVDKLYDELSNCKVDYVSIGPVNVRPDDHSVIVFDTRKYYDRAINYQKQIIPALKGEDYPPFEITLSDISPPLQDELVLLPTFQLQKVLREAVLRIFYEINEQNKLLFNCNRKRKPRKKDRLALRDISLAREANAILKVDLPD